MLGKRKCRCHVFDTLGYEALTYDDDGEGGKLLPIKSAILCPVASVQSSFAAVNKNVDICGFPGDLPWSIGAPATDTVEALASPYGNPVNPFESHEFPAEMDGVLAARLAADPDTLKFRYAVYLLSFRNYQDGLHVGDPNSFGCAASVLDLSQHPPALVGHYPFPAGLRHILAFTDAARATTGAEFYDGYYPPPRMIGTNPNGIIWWGHGPNIHSIIRFDFRDDSYTWGGNIVATEDEYEIQYPARRAEDFWVIAYNEETESLATGIWTGTAGDHTYSTDTGNLPNAILASGEVVNVVSSASGYAGHSLVDYTRAGGKDLIIASGKYYNGTSWTALPFSATTIDADLDGNIYLANSERVDRLGSGGWSVTANTTGDPDTYHVQQSVQLSFNRNWVHAKGFNSGRALASGDIFGCGEGGVFAKDVLEPWLAGPDTDFQSDRFVGWSIRISDGAVRVPHRTRPWGGVAEVYEVEETDLFMHNYYTGRQTFEEMTAIGEAEAVSHHLGVNVMFDAIPCQCGDCVPDAEFH